MSTKIYNAFKYEGTYGNLIKDLDKIREGIITSVKEHYKKKAEDNTLLNEFLWDKSETLLTKVARADDDVVIIYVNNDKLYVQFFGSLWNKLDDTYYSNFKEYAYQNQSGPPYTQEVDTVKRRKLRRDWNTRKKVWDKILNKYITPKMAGTTYYLINTADYIRIALDLNKEKKEK